MILPVQNIRTMKAEDEKMEDKKYTEKEALKEDTLNSVSGGSGFRGGYCAQTPDRTCRVEEVGSWDPDNEICRTCGWRAW